MRIPALAALLVASLLVAPLFVTSLFAQSLSPSLIGSAGGSTPAGGPDVGWSLGEPIAGAEDGSAGITSGYQQLEEQIPTPVVAASKGLSRIRLKRSTGGVKIIFDRTQTGYRVNLYNFKGRELARFSIAEGQKDLFLPARALGGGPAILRVFDRSEKNVQNFRLVN